MLLGDRSGLHGWGMGGLLGERGLYYPVVLEWEREPDERRGAPFAKVRIGSG